MIFAFALTNAPRATRFITVFVASFISSGLLYGIIYVLMMRAIRVNRQDVEEWLERLRLRLLSGPVPVIERVYPVMLGALYAIYGRTVGRRFVASLCIGVLFSGVVFGILYYEYRHVPVSVWQIKANLEREADPFLYKYFTTPELASDYRKAFETETYISVDSEGHEHYYTVFKYDNKLSVEIRTATSNYDSHFLAVTSSIPIVYRSRFCIFSKGIRILQDFANWTPWCSSFSMCCSIS